MVQVMKTHHQIVRSLSGFFQPNPWSICVLSDKPLVHDGVSRPMDRRSRYQRDKPRQSECSKDARSRPADSRTYEPGAHFRRAVLAGI